MIWDEWTAFGTGNGIAQNPLSYWLLRRMMKTMNQELPETRKILELNPRHSVIENLQELYEKERSGDKLRNYVLILFDLGTVMAGGRPDDPARFGKMVSTLLEK